MRRSGCSGLTTAQAVLCLGLALAGTQTAFAVDGVIEINEARALAGGVTASDTPGYPITLDRSGSYRLTGNLTVAAFGDPMLTTAVLVGAAQNVTIDLNGFTILGPTACTGVPAASCTPSGTGRGIDASARQAVTVTNGIVRGFPGNGLVLGPRARVEGVVASSNGADGINVGGNSVVRDSRASQNGDNGIVVGVAATVTASSADSNGQNGFRTSTAGVVSNSTATSNDGDGFVAFEGSILRDNAARANGNAGFSSSAAISVMGNTATSNTAQGLLLGNGSGYAQNVLIGNNGGDANAQVVGGVDLGANICGLPGVGNGIACP